MSFIASPDSCLLSDEPLGELVVVVDGGPEILAAAAAAAAAAIDDLLRQ